jgi:hypothetical protein
MQFRLFQNNKKQNKRNRSRKLYRIHNARTTYIEQLWFPVTMSKRPLRAEVQKFRKETHIKQ